MAEEDASLQERMSLSACQLLDLLNVFVKQLKAPVALNELIVIDALVRGGLDFKSTDQIVGRRLLLLLLFLLCHFVAFSHVKLF